MGIQLFIGGLGGPELVIILMLAVLLFGASKLPKLARASGEAMGEFQKGRENLEQEIDDARDATSMETETTNAEATGASGTETTSRTDGDASYDEETEAATEPEGDDTGNSA